MEPTSNLTCLFILCSSAMAQNETLKWPQRLEVELVFPRDTTYRPQFVFPVVFAVHNSAVLWPFRFQCTYSLDIREPRYNRWW